MNAYENSVDRVGLVGLGEEPGEEEALEGLQEGLRQHRLVEVELVVGGLHWVKGGRVTMRWSFTTPLITSLISRDIFFN